MLILRAVALLLGVAIAVCLGGWFLTGDRRYLRFSRRLLQYGLAVAIVFLALLLLERLIAPIL